MVQPHGKPLPVALQQPQEIGGIGVGGEDDFAVVAAVHHVVRDRRRPLLPPRFPGHRKILLAFPGDQVHAAGTLPSRS
jgi:hypothetical protein